MDAFSGDHESARCAGESSEFDLALSYAVKYEKASSVIHQKWVVFFEHALMRQVLKIEKMGKHASDFEIKFSSLFHVRLAAIRMKEAAEADEGKRRGEFRSLRKRCLDADKPRSKRPRVDESILLRAARVHDDRIFEKIASFV